MCEKVGPVVKWDSYYYRYYIYYLNQYVCGFSSFLALLVFFVLYFIIFNSLFSIFSTLHIFFSLPIHPQEALKNWTIQCKPVGLPTICSIELLVNIAFLITHLERKVVQFRDFMNILRNF